MKSRSQVVSLMVAFIMAFAITAIISPAVFAGLSEAYFSDVNGNPKTVWKVGETLYITVISHDENRDSDEVELIDTRSMCETHTTIPVPCVEVWNPDTKDSESNYGTIIMVETGSNTGIFRSQTGIAILPLEDDPGYQENGSLEVIFGDTIALRYQSPSDDNDIDLDLAKIDSNRATIRITNQAGQDVPVWQIGQQVWITVEDPDADIDPLAPDAIKGVTLWNPRCVWNVLERAGAARTDDPEPTPCLGPVAYDAALKNIAQNAGINPNPFMASLILYETGPSTGVFRNVNGITLFDQLGPDRRFLDVTTAFQLFVNHKDTIVAFYRRPTITGQLPQLPQQAGPTQTDLCAPNAIVDCSRTLPSQVSPGEVFDVTVEITAKQNVRLIGLSESAPAGFSFQSIKSVQPAAENAAIRGDRLRAAWDNNIQAGETVRITYSMQAGSQLGTAKIRGVVLNPLPTVPLISEFNVVAGASSASVQGMSVSAQASNASYSLNRSVTGTAAVGETFTVNLNFGASANLQFVSVKENYGGLTLVDIGTLLQDQGTTLRGIIPGAAPGFTQAFNYQLSCPSEGTFTISGSAETRGVDPVTETSTVICGAGGGNQPPPPPNTGAVTGFNRGRAGFNDPQDFALAQAKVGHLNPATLAFTDINGSEVTEFDLGKDLFLTLTDDDQNVDSDHIDTVCVQVFNVNGGREGDTPGVARDLNPLFKNDMRACMEDHVRDLFMWKTGLRLIETGLNTGVFRNADTLKIIAICAPEEAEVYPFDSDPIQTLNIQIHKHPLDGDVVPFKPGLHDDDPGEWWAEPSVRVGTALKPCVPMNPSNQEEARLEFPFPENFGLDNPDAAKIPGEDVPHKIAAHAGDVLYAVFQDQLVDPHDIVYSTTFVSDFQSFDGTTNNIEWVDASGNPVDTYKIGQDVFVKLRDDNRNVHGDVVDKVDILVLDRNSGDWENVILEETGTDTGVFMNHAGLSLQPAITPEAVRIDNNRLEMFDRDVIEAHYQDNFNVKDFSAAWIRLIPQPGPGPSGPVSPTPVGVNFSDSSGRSVADFGVGDSVYATANDSSANISSATVDVLTGALTVENLRTGASVTVNATETGADTGSFTSAAVSTSATGGGGDLEVEPGDTLQVTYRGETDTANVVSSLFDCTGARNVPNPFTTSTTFEAVGSGVVQIAVDVYDLGGRHVASLSASSNEVLWDGRDSNGGNLAAGVYLYAMTCSGRNGEEVTTEIQKLVRLR